MVRDFLAHEDSVGEGWHDLKATVNRWNEHIASVLQTAMTAAIVANDGNPDCDEPLVTTRPGIAARAADWAWDEFCARGAGDNDDAAESLGRELRAKLAD